MSTTEAWAEQKVTDSTVHLWGRSGRGHCRKFSANFRELSAEFPQTFRKNPFANDPIS